MLCHLGFRGSRTYVRIEMNTQEKHPQIPQAYKDAIFISPHKFIGGPGTPGILVLKRDLFKSQISLPGGGTVTYVTERHRPITTTRSIERKVVPLPLLNPSGQG